MEKTTNQISIYCDGGARGNPGPAAIGFVVKDSKSKTIHRYAQRIGKSTNNVAEYKAVIAALEWITKHKLQNLNQPQIYKFYLDSRLVVNQLTGKFRIKDPKLKNLAIEARNLERKANLISTNAYELFSSNQSKISYNLIPRERNSEADALLNEALNQQ